MTKKNNAKISPVVIIGTEKVKSDDGYPSYSVNEDIYSKSKEEENIDPENLQKDKIPNGKAEFALENEMEIEEDESGNDLDVPGAELDDEQEAIGSEDEENNYYSIGGDDYNYLDDDRD
jgi:hypothetical protein